jgi:ubiquitin carboxyl-terminal hydrolase 48
LFQLQATFASLERSKLAVFDPVNLIECLQLRASEQQDAQEYEGCRPTRLALISIQVFETIHVAAE